MSAYASVTETILQVGAWIKDLIANVASVPVSGTLTATIDESTLATTANQTNGAQIANASAYTSIVSTSPEASRVLKATAGTHYSTSVQLEPTAPSATYYVWMWKASATLPADGATSSSWLHTPRTIVHTINVSDPPVVFDDGPGGVAFTTGAGVALSAGGTGRTILAISGAYLLVDGSVR